MTLDEFKTQVDRLKNTFGDKPFADERIKILWREVSALDPLWFRRTVDEAIASLTYAPNVSYFAEKVSEERSRQYQLQKTQHTAQAKEFMSIFSGEDIQTICGQIKDRIVGKLGDESFNSFVKHLDYVSPTQGMCTCDRTGLAWVRNDNGTETVYRCFCSLGQARRESYPTLAYRASNRIVNPNTVHTR